MFKKEVLVLVILSLAFFINIKDVKAASPTNACSQYWQGNDYCCNEGKGVCDGCVDSTGSLLTRYVKYDCSMSCSGGVCIDYGDLTTECNKCNPGELRCTGSQTRDECLQKSDGCYNWGPIEVCTIALGGNTCYKGKCISGTITPTQPTCTPSTEVCDGKDNDCDGQVDEGCPTGGTQLPTDVTFLRCFGDDQDRALKSWRGGGGQVSFDTCYNWAKSNNFKYFGMQYPQGGNGDPNDAECFGGYPNGVNSDGSKYDRYGSKPCTEIKDSQGRYMGGGWENAVYEITSVVSTTPGCTEISSSSNGGSIVLCSEASGKSLSLNCGANKIKITSATYGGNCGATTGNQNTNLGNACNEKNSCSYNVNYNTIGDPKPGCAKDYKATYTCEAGTQPSTQLITVTARQCLTSNLDVNPDIDNNGQVDFNDFNVFLSCISSYDATRCKKLDFNNNNVIDNSFDFSCFNLFYQKSFTCVNSKNLCGDKDNTGKVDFNDFISFAHCLDPKEASCNADWDYNGDNIVNQQDWICFKQSYNTACGGCSSDSQCGAGNFCSQGHCCKIGEMWDNTLGKCIRQEVESCSCPYKQDLSTGKFKDASGKEVNSKYVKISCFVQNKLCLLTKRFGGETWMKEAPIRP